MAKQAGYFNDKQLKETTKCPVVCSCYICRGEMKQGTALYLIEGEKTHTEK